MTTYAKNTKVSTERSKGEIERTIVRFGAEQYLSGYGNGMGYIAFIYNGRAIRITVALPDKDDFRRTPGGRRARSEADTQRAWEQGCREQWRSLALLVKAKLVAITNGHASFEKEFLAYTMLPEGRTVHDWLEPQIVTMLESGEMPRALLPG